MRSNIAVAAALVRMVAAMPAPAPQQFDFNVVLQAPSPSITGPPVGVATQTTTYSLNTAAAAASISAEIPSEATASITGASASAASTEDPTSTDLQKRWNFAGWGWGQETTSSSSSSAKKTTPATTPTEAKQSKKTESSSSSSSSAKKTTPATTSTQQMKTESSSSSSSSSAKDTSVSTTSTDSKQSTTSTTSSSSACPTTPEEGTYCGFINPEDPCAPQPDGYGPHVTPDTADAFKNYEEFHQDAKTAKTPSGYEETFEDLDASTSANSYITFSTLESYDVQGCADKCDSIDLCTAFNIYIERDPGLNPTKDGDSSNSTGGYCPNPSSITNYKCSFWGSSIDADSATNEGGWRNDFQVVVVGSNGYVKTNSSTPPSQPGWEQPSNCHDKAISSGGDYWMGSKFFPGPYDPSVCSTYAHAQTSKNKESAKSKGKSSYTPCNMFNAYMLKKSGAGLGTYCSLFNTPLSEKWAAFGGSWQGEDYYGVESSWTYDLSEQDSGEL